MSQQDAVMVLHFDAGPDRNRRPRVVFVVVDAGANVLAAFTDRAELDGKYPKLPTLGPVDVKNGAYRGYENMARQGNPAVYHRRKGRTERQQAPLTATLGARSPNLHAMKRKLTGGRR